MMARDFGRTLLASASREVMTRTPSTSRPGSRRILQPVAIRIALAASTWPFFSPSITSTTPAVVTWARPMM